MYTCIQKGFSYTVGQTISDNHYNSLSPNAKKIFKKTEDTPDTNIGDSLADMTIPNVTGSFNDDEPVIPQTDPKEDFGGGDSGGAGASGDWGNDASNSDAGDSGSNDSSNSSEL